jgi:general secretion pathway protein I
MSAFPIGNRLHFFSRIGFTLLEVMVSLSIIAIVLVSVYRLVSQTIFMNIRSRFDTIAPLLAQKKLEELEINLKDISSGSGDFGDDFPGFEWKTSISTVTSDILGQVAKDMRRIDVMVYFQDENTSYEMRAYRVVYAD